MNRYVVENEVGRLDRVVSGLENNLSRMAIQRMIENGDILVNNKPQKASYKVNTGDIITVNEIKPVETALKEQPEIPIDIIYEDNDLIIINKQKGLVVHPGNGNPDGTLVNAIMARCKNTLSGIRRKIKARHST